MTFKDIKDRNPNLETIQLLETALEQAKSGELRSIITIHGWDDGGVTHGWSIDKRTARLPLLGCLSLLQTDFSTNVGLERGDSVLSESIE